MTEPAKPTGTVVEVTFLVFCGGQEAKKVIARGPRILVGKAPECAVRLDDQAAPTLQCALEPVYADGMYLCNLFEHGTLADGEVVHGRVKINPGASIAISDETKVVFLSTKIFFKGADHTTERPIPDDAKPAAKARPPFSSLLLALAKTTGEEGATEDAEAAIRGLGMDEQVVALQNAAEVFAIFALRNYEGHVLKRALGVSKALSDFVTARVELAQLQASIRETADEEDDDQDASE